MLWCNVTLNANGIYNDNGNLNVFFLQDLIETFSVG